MWAVVFYGSRRQNESLISVLDCFDMRRPCFFVFLKKSRLLLCGASVFSRLQGGGRIQRPSLFPRPALLWMMARQAQQRDMNISDSRRMIPAARKTTDHGVNFTNTAHLLRGVVSLRGNIFGQNPVKRVMPEVICMQEKADPQIDLLLNKQWTLYTVTPLYKFSYGQLQSYSNQLSLFIAAEKKKWFAAEAESDLTHIVKFSSVSVLKTTEREQASVLIQIMQKSQVAAESKEDKVLWMGLFCCTCGSDILETVMEDFTCLPLFLAHGTKSLSDLVESWLQQTFDCSLSHLYISPISLSWMAAMWSGCNVDKYTVPTELTFSVPCTTYPLDISYTIHPEDAKALWDSIQSTQGEVRQEEVELFMESLYNHFHRHFKIHLSATRLVNISTSIASAHSAGKIKILHAQYLVRVLSLLTELAISKIL